MIITRIITQNASATHDNFTNICKLIQATFHIVDEQRCKYNHRHLHNYPYIKTYPIYSYIKKIANMYIYLNYEYDVTNISNHIIHSRYRYIINKHNTIR